MCLPLLLSIYWITYILMRNFSHCSYKFVNLGIKKNLYNLGARNFWIHNTGPIGCLPYILVRTPSSKRDEFGCSIPHNELAQSFNRNLKNAVDQLRKDLPRVRITYVDMFSAKYSLISNAKNYGMYEPNEKQ